MHKDDIIKQDIKNIVVSIQDITSSLEEKTVLVTGGSGFLGKYIVGTLYYLNTQILKKPCRVISVDNYITSSKKDHYHIPSNKFISYKKRNVVEPFNIKEKIDLIVHAAGIASPVYYQKYPLETIEVAVTGTQNMLKLAVKKKVKSFLYFSSSEVYGNPTSDAIPTKETYNGNVSSVGPRACYDESKRLGETFCITYYAVCGIPVKIVRPFNIYGPGMRPKDYRVIPSFIFNALYKKPLPVHVGGRQTRSFCYISDAIVAIFKALLSKKNGEVYNIGNDEKEIDMNELAGVINKIFGNKLKIKHIPYPNNYPIGEPQRRYPDLSKIRKELKYKPKVSLEEGLRRTIAWCKINWDL